MRTPATLPYTCRADRQACKLLLVQQDTWRSGTSRYACIPVMKRGSLNGCTLDDGDSNSCFWMQHNIIYALPPPDSSRLPRRLCLCAISDIAPSMQLALGLVINTS